VAEYSITIPKGGDKQAVMALFSSIINPLLGSNRVFIAEVADEDLQSYEDNNLIQAIELTDDIVKSEHDN